MQKFVNAALCGVLVICGSCGRGGHDSAEAMQAGDEPAAAVLPSPLPASDAYARGAVRSNAALLVSVETGGQGIEESAAFTAEDGDPLQIDFPNNSEERQQQQNLTAIATKDGFALGGYQCQTDPALIEPSCSEIVGTVLFLDAEGSEISIQTTPATNEASSLDFTPGPDNAVIVEGPEAWLVSPTGVEPILDAPRGPLCGRPGGGLYVAETVSAASEAPEDPTFGYRILSRQADGNWATVHEVDYGDGGVYAPFCTPTGLFVGDKFFDGEELDDLELAPGDRLTDQEVVGFTSGNIVLTRALPEPDSDSASEVVLPAWIGLSRDGQRALRQTADDLELVDV